MSSYSSKTTKTAGAAYIDADKYQADKEPAAVIDIKNNQIIIC